MGERVVKLFWQYINNADFDGLDNVMTNDAMVWLPNTKEVFKGKSKYIEFNKRYPDRWYVDLEKLYSSGETIISVAKIFNKERSMSFYVTSFFKLKDDLIEEITEYWGENGEPPKWRIDEKLSERYK
ncbi:nuclear transport factor 2 family protein [Dethiothermospora halolimnae]|uniref:nuclear transport factor 2 family protein n=1 Tax=Dethiothermospora halolimnae TaxID=3114390 RepID=UPI003CCB8507